MTSHGCQATLAKLEATEGPVTLATAVARFLMFHVHY
jgi:hypothetical protein